MSSSTTRCIPFASASSLAPYSAVSSCTPHIKQKHRQLKRDWGVIMPRVKVARLTSSTWGREGRGTSHHASQVAGGNTIAALERRKEGGRRAAPTLQTPTPPKPPASAPPQQHQQHHHQHIKTTTNTSKPPPPSPPRQHHPTPAQNHDQQHRRQHRQNYGNTNVLTVDNIEADTTTDTSISTSTSKTARYTHHLCALRASLGLRQLLQALLIPLEKSVLVEHVPPCSKMWPKGGNKTVLPLGATLDK